MEQPDGNSADLHHTSQTRYTSLIEIMMTLLLECPLINRCYQLCYFLTEVVRITQDNAELTRIIEELSKSSVSVVCRFEFWPNCNLTSINGTGAKVSRALRDVAGKYKF